MFNLRFVLLFSFGLLIQPFSKIVAADRRVVKPSQQVFSLSSLDPKALYPRTACRCLTEGICFFAQILNVLQDEPIYFCDINKMLAHLTLHESYFIRLWLLEYNQLVCSFNAIKNRMHELIEVQRKVNANLQKTSPQYACSRCRAKNECHTFVIFLYDKNLKSVIQETIENARLLHNLMRGGKKVSAERDELSSSWSLVAPSSGMPSHEVRRPRPVRGETQKFAAVGDDFSQKLSCGECSHCGTRGFHNSSVCPNLNANLPRPD